MGDAGENGMLQVQRTHAKAMISIDLANRMHRGLRAVANKREGNHGQTYSGLIDEAVMDGIQR